jgi:hypothetical protein
MLASSLCSHGRGAPFLSQNTAEQGNSTREERSASSALFFRDGSVLIRTKEGPLDVGATQTLRSVLLFTPSLINFLCAPQHELQWENGATTDVNGGQAKEQRTRQEKEADECRQKNPVAR